MPGEMHHPNNAGPDSNAPFWSSAIALYVGVALMIVGMLLIVYLDGTLRFIVGGTLVLLGMLSPIVTFFIFGKKSD
jgi:hypothetical protein